MNEFIVTYTDGTTGPIVTALNIHIALRQAQADAKVMGKVVASVAPRY